MSDGALAHPQGTVGDSLVASVWTLISRATGFARVAVTAAVPPPGVIANDSSSAVSSAASTSAMPSRTWIRTGNSPASQRA